MGEINCRVSDKSKLIIIAAVVAAAYVLHADPSSAACFERVERSDPRQGAVKSEAKRMKEMED